MVVMTRTAVVVVPMRRSRGGVRPMMVVSMAKADEQAGRVQECRGSSDQGESYAEHGLKAILWAKARTSQVHLSCMKTACRSGKPPAQVVSKCCARRERRIL